VRGLTADAFLRFAMFKAAPARLLVVPRARYTCPIQFTACRPYLSPAADLPCAFVQAGRTCVAPPACYTGSSRRSHFRGADGERASEDP
jgi:hypothetical protein